MARFWMLVGTATLPFTLLFALTPPPDLDRVFAQDDAGDEKQAVPDGKRATAGEEDEARSAAKRAADERRRALKELVGDIKGNMKRIEDLLNERKTDRDTQTVQARTVEKIQKLIDMFPP